MLSAGSLIMESRREFVAKIENPRRVSRNCTVREFSIFFILSLRINRISNGYLQISCVDIKEFAVPLSFQSCLCIFQKIGYVHSSI